MLRSQCKENNRWIPTWLGILGYRFVMHNDYYDHMPVWHSWLAKKVLIIDEVSFVYRTKKIKWWLPMFGWIKNGMTNCSHGTQQILEASLALESLVTSFGYQILCYTTSKLTHVAYKLWKIVLLLASRCYCCCKVSNGQTSS